jgi:hypothetical protein
MMSRKMSASILFVASLLMGSGHADAVEFGVYRGPGCDGRAKIPEFERFAGRKVQRTVDALSQKTWKSFDESIDWVVGCWKNSGLKLTLSVPMLPEADGGTLADGASGKHDDIFRHVARALIDNGYSDATIRIGWEFNGDWMPWAAAKDPDAYIAYFRRIVSIMRAAPGARFQFEWCPNHERHQIDPPRVYPGDDVVDLIGMDVYDEVWGPDQADAANRWVWYVDQPFGLRWHKSFARLHGKPIAYSEWGTGVRPDGHGAGDDPIFIQGMADWFAETEPLYQSYWDNSSPEFNTMLSNGQFKQAAEAFVARFRKPQ